MITAQKLQNQISEISLPDMPKSLLCELRMAFISDDYKPVF